MTRRGFPDCSGFWVPASAADCESAWDPRWLLCALGLARSVCLETCRRRPVTGSCPIHLVSMNEHVVDRSRNACDDLGDSRESIAIIA